MTDLRSICPSDPNARGRTPSPFTRDRRYRPEYNRDNRSRSPGSYRRNDNRGTSGPGNDRINPNYRNKRVCWGCGSPDHLLRDRKCTPTLNSIKTNLVLEHYGSPEQVHFMAEEFIILYSTSQIDTANTNISLERSGPDTLERQLSNSRRQNVTDNEKREEFDVSVYNLSGEDVYAARIASDFSKDIFSTMYASSEPDSPKLFDFFRVYFPTTISSPEIQGFCLDIGAPCSVIRQKELHKILIKWVDLTYQSLHQQTSSDSATWLSPRDE